MTEVTIDGRPAELTKEDGKVKIIFHPIAKGAKHPKAKVFQTRLSKSDLDVLKKVL